MDPTLPARHDDHCSRANDFLTGVLGTLLSRRDSTIVASHEYLFSASHTVIRPDGPGHEGSRCARDPFEGSEPILAVPGDPSGQNRVGEFPRVNPGLSPIAPAVGKNIPNSP
jgi:hypothetical protein